MDKVKLGFQIMGEIGTLFTMLALVFPKGNKLGYWLAKIGTDIKGHTQPTDDVKEPSDA